jgi:hypothetical protein
MSRNYATEEEVEDAFVAYLASVLPGDILVRAAMTVDALTYPSVVVTVQGNDNASEVAGWTEHRLMQVEIALGVEAKNITAGASVLQTLRERNTELREAVLGALTVPNLLDLINASGRVRFSLLVFGSIQRRADGTVMETIIPIAVTV